MIGYLTIRTNDLDRAIKYYEALLVIIGIQKPSQHRDMATCGFKVLQTMNERRIFMIMVHVFLLMSGTYLCGLLIPSYNTEIHPLNEDSAVLIIVLSTAVFVIASAVPFVPGAEIGLGMMLMLGGEIAPLVYIAMVGH